MEPGPHFMGGHMTYKDRRDREVTGPTLRLSVVPGEAAFHTQESRPSPHTFPLATGLPQPGPL